MNDSWYNVFLVNVDPLQDVRDIYSAARALRLFEANSTTTPTTEDQTTEFEE
jgi:hypothetical protein